MQLAGGPVPAAVPPNICVGVQRATCITPQMTHGGWVNFDSFGDGVLDWASGDIARIAAFESVRSRILPLARFILRAHIAAFGRCLVAHSDPSKGCACPPH